MLFFMADVLKPFIDLFNVKKALKMLEKLQAHVCIAFVAYTVYKELERLLNQDRVEMSPKRAIELTQNMYAIECQMPDEMEKKRLILKMDPEQQIVCDTILQYCRTKSI